MPSMLLPGHVLLCTLAILLVYVNGQDLHHHNSTQTVRCWELCASLKTQFPSLLDFPHDPNYTSGQQYWSQQQSQTLPACRFSPTCAEDISVALLEVRRTQCPFAVKSGGHASFKGASNIPDGLTIDLRNLNSRNVSADRKTTYLGTGNRWEDVYSYLDPQNLAVVGGRNGDIGVGGLTLGGGISFFSGYRGWACDNVANYEAVLANGSIVNANSKEKRDLYWALRGGGNNFAVVTRMDLETVDQGVMWGGSTVYTTDKNSSVYDAFYWYNKNAAQDTKAALIASAACAQVINGCILSNNYEYSTPVVEPPAIFENFTSIANVSTTQRNTNLLNLTEELKATQPDGYRQAFATMTFQNDAQLMKDILNQFWYPAVQPLINSTDGFLTSLVFQPLTEPIIANFQKNGGNALGITDENGPLIIMNMDFQWNKTSDDDLVLGIEQNILNQSIQLAKERGLYNRYIYQNYAYITQDVFAGYGPESVAKLREVQKAYDPELVFQELQPGYFKLRPST